MTSSLEDTLFAEEVARRPGVLQGVDPRAKLIGVGCLVVAVSLAHQVPTLLGLYGLALLLAGLGRIEVGFFVRRVWLLLPFFTGIIALPAIFNVVTPGQPLITLLDHPVFLAITEQGVRTAVLLLLRVADSVSFAIILVLTTPWALLLRALRSLRVPQVFVVILGMTYRYIFLLLHVANDMFLARKSRLMGRLPEGEERRWLISTVGTLLGKSYDLSEHIYLAMISRGFRGEARVLEPLRLRGWDVVWALGGFLIIAVVMVGERVVR
jgi:cobalt ECF transporter T component CbiQ